jgi:hypothetical protein
VVTGSNWQGQDMESREVVKVQLYPSWSDTAVPNENNKSHAMVEQSVSRLPKIGVLYGT